MAIEPIRPQTTDSRWTGVDENTLQGRGHVVIPWHHPPAAVPGFSALACELRYFEMPEPAGYSTLERHEHAHAVMIQRGGGLGAGR